MPVDVIARANARIATMSATAESYDIEAKWLSDKAIDLRLGIFELRQFITMATELSEDVADETSAAKPGSEVAASDAVATLAGEVFPSASPAPHPVANVGEDASGAIASASVDPASREADDADRQQFAASGFSGDVAVASQPTHRDADDEPVREATATPISAPAPTDETGTAFSSEPIPVYSRAGHIGSWVRGAEKAVDADNEEQDLVEVLAHEKAPDPAPAGEGGASPAPTVQQRVKALHDAHPEYTAKQAREALGLTKGSLSGASFMLGVKWTHETLAPKFATEPPPEPQRQAVQFRPGSTGDRVRIVLEQHPTWTARMIADHLGAPEKTVANALGELRRQAKPEPVPEFSGRAELVGHYTDVAKRLGKV